MLIRGIPNDYGDPDRERILLVVMTTGGIVDATSVIRACREVLCRLAGEHTMCRLDNLAAREPRAAPSQREPSGA